LSIRFNIEKIPDFGRQGSFFAFKKLYLAAL